MDQPIVQGLLTFLGSAVVAGLNALLSARLLDKKPAAFASFSAVRQLFNVAYLVLVFFGSRSRLGRYGAARRRGARSDRSFHGFCHASGTAQR